MRVRVIITDDHGCVLQDGCLPVNLTLERDARQAIDFPSPTCDAVTEAVFCTPPKQRLHIQSARIEVSKAITAELMHFFEARDTEMGYQKN